MNEGKLLVWMRKLNAQGESADMSDLKVVQDLYLELDDPCNQLQKEYKRINILFERKKQNS